MPWEYLAIPEGLRLPACDRCSNRGRVVMVAPGVFVCTDCSPAHVFRARWVKEATLQAEAAESTMERAG